MNAAAAFPFERLNSDALPRHKSCQSQSQGQGSSGVDDNDDDGASLYTGALSGEQFINRQELCSGVASTIYLATCAATRAKVVLKVYTKRRLSARQKSELARELALLKRLAGPYVVRLLGSFETDSDVVLVLEHCAGGDLFKAMIVRGLVADEQWACVEVVAPLLRLLEKMHRLNVSHRDIKPENIFLTARGELRLGDFGLAIDNSRELAFARVGTLDYMAPEVLCNPKTRVCESPAVTLEELSARGIAPYGPAVDVWAVGVLAYELVTSRPPFECDDEREETELILNSNSIRFPPGRLAAWADFVRSVLTKDPRLRPTAYELLEHPFITGGIMRALRGGPLQRKPSAELLLRPMPFDGPGKPPFSPREIARTTSPPIPCAQSLDSKERGLGLPHSASAGALLGGDTLPLGRSPLGRSPLGRSPLGRSPLGSERVFPVISEASESDSDEELGAGGGSLLSSAIASLLSGGGLSRNTRIHAGAFSISPKASNVGAESPVAGSSPPRPMSISHLLGSSSFDSFSGARKPGLKERLKAYVRRQRTHTAEPA
jgi:serine/threonine protein kinase